MAGDQGLVTPEAVRLDFPEATVGSRGVAIALDWMVMGLIALILTIAVGAAASNAWLPDGLAGTLAAVGSLLLLFGYPIAFETVLRGRTPGKAAMGLRVVTAEGAPVSFRHAAIRGALGLVDFYLTFGLAAVLSSLLSRRHQRLGDFVAGTVVLRERRAGQQTAARLFAMPAAAAPLAAAIDTSGLTDRDYGVVRAYLLRADSLRPQRRDEVGRQVLDAIGPRLGALPPSTLPPEVLLGAIAARYQQRTQRAHHPA